MNEEYVLEGLFLHLVRLGFPLGIRDYRDALLALRGGHGAGNREDLLWLCHTLWARTNEESRQLDLLFHSFPFPKADEVEALTGQQEEPLEDLETPQGEETPTPANAKRKRSPAEDRRPVPTAEFVTRERPEGIGLPRATAEPNLNEIFILHRRPLVSMRALTIIWRRFRSTRREGPRIELDLDATIQEQCRQGLLERPVLVPARRNQAKLVVLMDVSDSMIPWQDFGHEVVESLRASQLGRAGVYYFHNAPTDVLYQKETLTGPVQLGKVLQDHPGSTLLILSDAGAARGSYRAHRINESAEFLARAWRHWQPIVWMNPMPRARWKQTSAEEIGRLPHASMLQLNEEGLVKAIDVLRGKLLNIR